MPITPTYPGIYVEEVLSNAHSITAAPTSVAVFVGYTHPYKTKAAHYTEAVQVFSFTDYEREFGGLFDVGWMSDDVGRAVFQFFANGGAVAWIIALQAEFHPTPGPGPAVTIAQPTLSVPCTGGNLILTGLEPVDDHHQLLVSITNPRTSAAPPATTPLDLADITITYGSRVETYRKVSLNSTDPANSPAKRIGTVDNPVSSLVTVSTSAPLTAWPSAAIGPIPLTFALPAPPFTTFYPGDFTAAFEADQPLDKIPIFNLLLTPGVWDQGVVGEALAVAERKRAFMIVDPPADAVADPTGAPLPLIADVMTNDVPKSQNGALYFPYLMSHDPSTGSPLAIPPSGFVAGVIAREDTNRGVWKAPAGYEAIVHNTSGVVSSGRMTDPRQGTLNPIGVNCLRTLPGIGTVVFGARTLVAANEAFEQYRYVPVRRMALFLEQSLVQSLGWVIFEPNDVPLWVSIKTTIDSFMLGLFHQGAFQGTKPSQAFQVSCDATTTTPDDQANGIVNIVVAFAPLKPAEFVIIKIAQLAGQAQS